MERGNLGSATHSSTTRLYLAVVPRVLGRYWKDLNGDAPTKSPWYADRWKADFRLASCLEEMSTFSDSPTWILMSEGKAMGVIHDSHDIADRQGAVKELLGCWLAHLYDPRAASCGMQYAVV